MATIDLDLFYAETMSKFEKLWQASESVPSTRQGMGYQDNSRTERQCEFCRNTHPATHIIIHHIVPEDIVEKMGSADDTIVELCFSCHRALHNWNNHNVSWVHYDATTRRHRAKSLAEIAEEYESAYQKFLVENFQQDYPRTSAISNELEVVGNLSSAT